MINFEQYKKFSVCDDNIFRFFREFNVFSMEIFQILFQILDVTKNVTRNVTHDETRDVRKAGKVDPGNRVTLPVKFACK